VKLTVLGGGGARIPALIRAAVGDHPTPLDRIDLFEPDESRRASIGRLSTELATALGYPDTVHVTDDVEEALTGADYIFSAIRVGGDNGRIIDEQVALERGFVGQETTGPGGCAMALRTIPVVLKYCDVIARVAPEAVVINFTNPAGIITQAITSHSQVKAVGVCDTPNGAQSRIADFLGLESDEVAFSYAGLNHLGWISSVKVGGTERIGELLDRYEELRAFNQRFAAFDSAFVRRIGCIPTEYLYYYYDPRAYVASVSEAGTTRGQDILRFNDRLVSSVTKAFQTGDVNEAWATYSQVMGARHHSYMRLDVSGESTNADQAASGGPEPLRPASRKIGGYEGVALRVIDGLSGASADSIIINTRNGRSLDFLEPDDVVEVPALVDKRGMAPLASDGLPRSPRALVQQVKEYERAVVQAAVTGDAELAALALGMNPLVPGIRAARELMGAYRERHGRHLAYLR
jgi:6-phospho-beta-glucosidase